jgi:integrase/recombinase XerD
MAKRASPRFADWPEADRVLWGRLTARGSVLDGSGPGAHWRPRTEQYHRESYGLWLAWLMAREPATLALPPLQRATPERMATWIYTGTHLRPITRLNRFIAVRRVLTLLEPAADWSRHRRIEARLYREASHARSPRKIGRIVETDVIFHAAVRHHKLLCDQPHTRSSAVARRNAVMLALLALMPVRRQTFTDLRLGISFEQRGESWIIVLEPETTKTDSFWESTVPPLVMPLLTAYLQEVRPLLLARSPTAQDHLWLTCDGRPISAHSVGLLVPALLQRLIGTPICCHLLRDCAVTTLVRTSSQAARLTAGLLGHSSDRTAQRHYNHATTLEAGRTLHAILSVNRTERRR